VLKKHDIQNIVNLDPRAILEDLSRRSIFKYTLFDAWKYLYCCLSCRRQRIKQLDMERHAMYERGEKKMQEELDIVNFIRTIRRVKLLSQVLLSKKQDMLLKFQRNNVLNERQQSDDESDEDYKVLKQMRDENVWERMKVSSKLLSSI